MVGYDVARVFTHKRNHSRVVVFVSVDMNVDCLDEKAVMTYIACLCDALHGDSASAAAAVHQQEVYRAFAFFLSGISGRIASIALHRQVMSSQAKPSQVAFNK